MGLGGESWTAEFTTSLTEENAHAAIGATSRTAGRNEITFSGNIELSILAAGCDTDTISLARANLESGIGSKRKQLVDQRWVSQPIVQGRGSISEGGRWNKARPR